MKKLVTLLLTLVMLVSVLALPTLAATAEETHVCSHEIQPRYPVATCPYCGGSAIEIGPAEGDRSYFTCTECHRTFKG